jgi:hypothetical protein
MFRMQMHHVYKGWMKRNVTGTKPCHAQSSLVKLEKQKLLDIVTLLCPNTANIARCICTHSPKNVV